MRAIGAEDAVHAARGHVSPGPANPRRVATSVAVIAIAERSAVRRDTFLVVANATGQTNLTVGAGASAGERACPWLTLVVLVAAASGARRGVASCRRRRGAHLLRAHPARSGAIDAIAA